MKTFYILNNIGTPEAPTTEAVAPYLTEFLTDPEVIPLPYFLRHLLVRGWIVPRRAPASAEKYALIWTTGGSPLLVNAEALRAELQKHLDGPVLLGMQFGAPGFRGAIKQAKDQGAERIVYVPLYPQFAGATTGSAVKTARAYAAKIGFTGRFDCFPHFPVSDFFVRPLANIIRQAHRGQHILFTFHGLPESQVKKGAAGCLQSANCCDRPFPPTCYRSQSFATARALAKELQLQPDSWSVSFQSRLGRAKWISPYTEDVLQAMPAGGIKRVLVASPSFVSDCLETLEELGHQGRHTFMAAGGEEYRLAPCVNADAAFAEGLAKALLSYDPKV